MVITQTVDIPESHRLTIDVPREVPAGKVILTFTPATSAATDECPICAKHRDPETGNPRYKAEVMAGFKEVEDMLAGKIPNTMKSFNSFDEMWEDLERDDPDD
jgi:hypothetical protein